MCGGGAGVQCVEVMLVCSVWRWCWCAVCRGGAGVQCENVYTQINLSLLQCRSSKLGKCIFIRLSRKVYNSYSTLWLLQWLHALIVILAIPIFGANFILSLEAVTCTVKVL